MLAAASIFKNALLEEAYKSYFHLPFTEDVREFDEDVTGGFKMRRKGYTLRLSYECDDNRRLFGYLRSYLQRSYGGMSAHEADEIFDSLDCCTFYLRLCFKIEPQCGIKCATIETHSIWHASSRFLL